MMPVTTMAAMQSVGTNNNAVKSSWTKLVREDFGL